MFRVPYRWTARTCWVNITYLVWDVCLGVRNVFCWLPFVWFDRDCDWDSLAGMMEVKLDRMAGCIEGGLTVNGPRHAKQMRVCAALLRRIRRDEYFQNAGYASPGWEAFPAARKRWAALHAGRMLRQDQRYLGVLLGKHLTSWWD